MNFSKKYDVAVIGGGIAGVAAAVAAARCGKKTVLLEKTVMLGGLATAGLIYIYLPLCDGNGQQVTFGISEELLKLSIKYGPGAVPRHWQTKENAPEHERYRTMFSPASLALALDEIATEAQVDIWFDTLFCSSQLDANNRLCSVEVENESGRGCIEADCFIDASGSGIVARRAGATGAVGNNKLAMWALEYNDKSSGNDKLGKNIKMYQAGMGDELLNHGISGQVVSEFTLDSRNLLRESYQHAYNSGKADRNNRFPLTLPTMPQFRKIYAVNGTATLSSNQHSTFFANSIGLVADWRKAGYVWEIPYGTLIPEKITGLLTAGRCISSVDDAWEVTRVIPAAALTGEVAGIAASLAVEKNITPDKLAIDQLQTTLQDLGFILHLKDIANSSLFIPQSSE
jgi:hypothetical protein